MAFVIITDSASDVPISVIEEYKLSAFSLLDSLPYDTAFLKEIVVYTAERKY